MNVNQKVIVYNEDDGCLAIIVPSECFLKRYPIQEIAKKDVPKGKPFKIIEASIIPKDQTFRDAWEMDISKPDGYGIGGEEWLRLNKNRA